MNENTHVFLRIIGNGCMAFFTTLSALSIMNIQQNLEGALIAAAIQAGIAAAQEIKNCAAAPPDAPKDPIPGMAAINPEPPAPATPAQPPVQAARTLASYFLLLS
jgi:hypothetical protein